MRPTTLGKRLAAFALLLAGHALAAVPLGTAFTYQGQLKQGGVPLNATCDFQFTLWDDPVAREEGHLVGAQVAPNLGVANGLFTVDLDFGSEPFGGEARWLEIALCCPGPDDPPGGCFLLPDAFTTLAPAQKLAPAPYALYALASGGAGAGDTLGDLSCASGEVAKWNGSAWVCAQDDDTDTSNTLDQAYDQGGGGAGRTITADAGAVQILGAGGLEVAGTVTSGSSITIDGSTDTITASSGTIGFADENLTTAGLVESTVAGFKFPDATVQTTAAGAGNTLDEAYDQGGAGSGRTITADAGAVQILGDSGLEVSGTITSGSSITINGFTDTITATSGTISFDNENLVSSGTVTATAFVGDGSGLTGLPGGGSGFWTASGSDIYNNNSGNVGIGTLLPAFPLDVGGEVRINDMAGLRFPLDPFGGSGDLARIFLEQDAPGTERISLVIQNDNDGPGTSEDNIRLRAANLFVEPNSNASTSESGGNLLVTSGHVGIGTTSPEAYLHVRPAQDTTADEILKVSSPADAEYGSHDVAVIQGGLADDYTSTVLKVESWSNDSSNYALLDVRNNVASESPSSKLYVRGDGNVGIGTSSPNAKLHVYRKTPLETGVDTMRIETFNSGIGGPRSIVINRTEIDGEGTTIGLTLPLKLNSNSDGDVLLANGGGRVGIGMSTHPDARLQVVADAGSGLFVAASGAAVGTLLNMDNPSSGGSALWVSSNSNSSPAVRIISAGTARALEVEGTARVKVLEISGADLAEKFPVSQKVAPGMVVAIDPKHPGKLCLAHGAYNRRVAGVVSGANGLPTGAVLGHLAGNEDAPAVALSGRVWVYCDATEAPLEPGDLLTTSATPGHAMKVVDYPRAQGAIIGKAMTALPEGRGMVLVLVSLQ